MSATKATADDVANIYGKDTDDVAKVYEDGGDNNARKNTLDAVIINTETSELRIDDDQEEDNKYYIGDVTEIFPNNMDWAFFIGWDWINLDKILKNIVSAIDNIGEEAGTRTNKPANTADLIVTGRIFFCSGLLFWVFWVIRVVWVGWIWRDGSKRSNRVYGCIWGYSKNWTGERH